MMHIQVPYDVEVKPWAAILSTMPDAQPQKLSFLTYATATWLDDERAWINDDGKQSVVKLRRWGKVIDAFEKTKPGQWISMDDEDYGTLKRIVESPKKVFTQAPTQIALAAIPFVDAVLEAKHELPAILDGKAATA